MTTQIKYIDFKLKNSFNNNIDEFIDEVEKTLIDLHESNGKEANKHQILYWKQILKKLKIQKFLSK